MQSFCSFRCQFATLPAATGVAELETARKCPAYEFQPGGSVACLDPHARHMLGQDE